MIASKIMHLKNGWIRKPLWVLWFPFEYISLCHDHNFKNNFGMWVATVFFLGWDGV